MNVEKSLRNIGNNVINFLRSEVSHDTREPKIKTKLLDFYMFILLL